MQNVTSRLAENSKMQVSFEWKMNMISPWNQIKAPIKALPIQLLPIRWNRYWKDLGHLNILKFAQTLSLKSTIFTQLTEVWINLVKFCMLIEIPLWKNYLLWGVWIIWNMQFYFLPIGLYGKYGMFWWLWKCTKTFHSVMDRLLVKVRFWAYPWHVRNVIWI